MKKIRAFLEGLTGKSKENDSPQPRIGMVDPQTILYSLPTIAKDLPELEEIPAQPSSGETVLHEDDWRQLEFLPTESLADIQRQMKEFKAFEAEHRVEHGWRKIFVRPSLPGATFGETFTLTALQRALENNSPERIYLSTTSSSPRAVKNGFALPLGGNVLLYGDIANNRVRTLAGSVGEAGDHMRVFHAFDRITSLHPVIVVDWRAMMIVTEKSGEQYQVWRP
ncbi:MAG: hypothetical protein JWQ98_1658 [Chlorobi bacterium]|nr:hypothetical protein [Chlorobiota bacterium]